MHVNCSCLCNTCMVCVVFTGSTSFLEAISDTKQYFPDGLCCQPTTITKEYNVNLNTMCHACVYVCVCFIYM